MEKKNTIRFFVSGIDNERKARYLARVIRTQEGVESSIYSFGNHILTVIYEPELISIDYMKELAYFSDCKLVAEEESVGECCKAWSLWRHLEKILFWEGMVLLLLVVYLLMGISSNDKESSYWEYILAFVVLLCFIGSLCWRKKLKDKLNNEE